MKKLINTEREDFIVIDKGIIYLVEAKSTIHNKYYFFNNNRKREQIKQYFRDKKILEKVGYKVRLMMLIKVKDKIEYIPMPYPNV